MRRMRASGRIMRTNRMKSAAAVASRLTGEQFELRATAGEQVGINSKVLYRWDCYSGGGGRACL